MCGIVCESASTHFQTICMRYVFVCAGEKDVGAKLDQSADSATIPTFDIETHWVSNSLFYRNSTGNEIQLPSQAFPSFEF